MIDVAKAGYGKTRKQVKATIKSVARDKGVLKAHTVSDGWWRRFFLERQPLLSLHKGDATANVWMECVNPETVKSSFALLRDTLEEHNLMAKYTMSMKPACLSTIVHQRCLQREDARNQRWDSLHGNWWVIHLHVHWTCR